MKQPKYILRFDDICSTMNWAKWENVENVLNRYSIKPILAVVPENKDPRLEVSRPRKDFWEYVRKLQEQGWSIALHGYQHVYENNCGGIIGLNCRSEFAGVKIERQREKIRNGLSIFSANGIKTNVWVAPAHSFDSNTLAVLREEGVNIISDGFSWRPYKRDGFIWIPQQLWRPRKIPFGTWTICYHTNSFCDKGMKDFEMDMKRIVKHTCSLDSVINNAKNNQEWVLDRIFHSMWRQMILKKRLVSRFAM